MRTIPSLLEFDELMALVAPTLQAHACEIHYQVSLCDKAID
jgi:hypothetical protein